MPFNVRVRPLARRQLREAYVSLELAREGAGERFDAAFHLIVQRMAENPIQFPVFEGTVRRALIRRFRYLVFFDIVESNVRILAVFHGSRDLSDWQAKA